MGTRARPTGVGPPFCPRSLTRVRDAVPPYLLDYDEAELDTYMGD